MIVCSLSVALLAFLPGTLALIGFSPSAVWRLSSTATGVVVLAFLVLRALPVLRAPSAGSSPKLGPLAWVFLLLTLSILLCQAINVIGLPWSPSAGPYALGLLLALCLAGLQFLLLALDRAGGAPPPGT